MCPCTLKRESVGFKFSTVQQFPWQLVELISVLQRMRWESLIISAWQRGPTDSAKAKHKVFCAPPENHSSLSPAAPPSHVSNCVGVRRLEPVCATLVFHFLVQSHNHLKIFFFPRYLSLKPYLPILTPAQCILAHKNIYFWAKKWVKSCQFPADSNSPQMGKKCLLENGGKH